MSQQINLQELT